MDAGDYVAAGSALVAVLAMIIAFWNARSAKAQALAAEHSLALAREQYANQLEVQRKQAEVAARDALVRIAMNLMEQGSLFKQAARSVRAGTGGQLAQVSIQEVSSRYVGMIGEIASLAEEAKRLPATLVALSAIAQIQEGIQELQPIVNVDPSRLDGLGAICQDSAVRILQKPPSSAEGP